MKEVQYRNMTVDELVSNWEVDDSPMTYKDTLIQKLIEELEKTEVRVAEVEKADEEDWKNFYEGFRA